MSLNSALISLRRTTDKIHVHGHRGARGVMAENTMAGFRHAVDLGVSALEFDVLFACDTTPMVAHYPRLRTGATRGENGAWLDKDVVFYSQTVAQLQAYDVGGLRDKALFPEQVTVAGERIPTLAELAAYLADPAQAGIWLNLEIKSHPDHPELFPKIADMVAAVMAVLKSHGVLGRTVIQSFDWRVLREVSVQAPDVIRSYLSDLPNPDTPALENIYEGSAWMDGLWRDPQNGGLADLIAQAGGHIWSPYFRDLTQADMDHARQLGLVVNVWTVNDPVDIERMIALGVDGIISDYPARVQRCLQACGLGWF